MGHYSMAKALGALFIGLTMEIVAAPCVGPIIVGLLLFVGSRQDPILGFLMFCKAALAAERFLEEIHD